MACNVIRDPQGNISKVQDDNGAESPIFVAIASHPLIKDTETALNVYKNTFLPKIGRDSEWQHKVGEIFTTDYSEALLQAETGEKIEVGFTNPEGEFFPIISTYKNTNKDSLEGFVNFQIGSGILSPKKEKYGTGYKFVAMGTGLENAVNTEILFQDAKRYLGTDGVTNDRGAFTFDRSIGTLKLQNKQGGTENVSYDDLDMMQYSEIEAKFEDPEFLVTDREIYQRQRAYRDTKFDGVPTLTERELQQSLLTLLSKMGVRTLPISEYVEKYEIRNRVAPQASALADIANQVIGYSQGEITLDQLTEETAHFITEAMPKEQTENVLRNIDKTTEWAEHSDRYREIYRGEYSEEELEDAVKREVLGKVVANSVKNNFSTEGKTGTQSSIINRIRELVDNFFNSIRGFFEPKYRQELDNYLNEIEKIVATKDIEPLDTGNFKYNRHRLYNAPPSGTKTTQLNNAAKRTIYGLRQQIKALSKKSPSKIRTEKLRKAEDLLDKEESVKSLSDIVEMAKADIKYIRSAIEDSEKNNKEYILSSEESSVFMTLKSVVGESLEEMSALTNEKSLKERGIKPDNNWKILNTEIKNTLDELTELKGEVQKNKAKNIERIVDEIVDKYNFPADTKDNLMKWAQYAESNTNLAHSVFSTLSTSKDGSLRMLGYLLRKMNTKAHTDYVTEVQALQKELADNGFDETFFKNELLDGDQITNEYNLPLFFEVLDDMYVSTYKKVTGSKLSKEDILKGKANNSLNFEGDEKALVDEEFKNLSQSIQERPMKESYYRMYEDKMKGVSNITKAKLSNYLSDISKLKRQAIREDGVLDWTSLSKAQREIWQDLTSERKSMKNIYDRTGNLKQGLEFELDTDGTILMENGSPVVRLSEADPSDEAIIAKEIIELDSQFEKQEEKGVSEKFFDDIRSMEAQGNTREEILDFVYSNAYIGMSQEYWDSLQGGNSILDRLKANGNTELYNGIVENRTKIKNILREHSRKNQPSEVDGNSMEQLERDSVKEYQEILDSLYGEANDVLPEEETDIQFSSSPNESYINHIRAMGIENSDDEYHEAKKHMTTRKASRVKDDLSRIDSASKGIGTMPKNAQRVLEEIENSGSELSKRDTMEAVKKTIIRNALLPYYKRSVSITYDVFSRELKRTDGNPISEILGSSELITVQPNYSFYQSDTNEDVNPAYDNNFRGGFRQPKKGDVTVNFDGTRKTYNFESVKYKELVKDPKKKRMYDSVMDTYKRAVDSGDFGEGYNLYQLPQVRKGSLERLDRTIKNPSRLSMAFKDAFTFTEDDQVKGDLSLGSKIKLIPKRFVYKLEDPSDVSEELFYSMNLMMEQAYLRNARTEAYGDILTVMDTIETRETSSDKKNSSTAAYKMARSAIDNGLHDITEAMTYEVTLPFTGKKVDLAKVARNVLNFVKLRNLGFNFIIPLTSAATGWAQRKIESYVGEFLDTRSQKMGVKEYNRLVGKGMRELGNIRHKEKLNVLGQYFKAFDINESFKNSNYSKTGRLLAKTGMGLHTLANYSLYGKNMLGSLMDHRAIDGKIMRWNDYRFQERQKGIPEKKAREEWNKFEDKVIYNFIDVKDGQVEIDDNRLSELIDNYDQQAVVDRVRGHIREINKRTDGQMSQEDTSFAKRHALWSYATQHRDWLSVGISSRFHSRLENFDSGKLTEGSYMSAVSFVKRYLEQFKEDGAANIIKGFKKAWDNSGMERNENGEMVLDPRLADVERANLKRIAVEWAFLQASLLVGLVLANMGDQDEEDPFILKSTNLLMARLNNEISSQQLGLGANVVDVMSTPIIALQFLKQASDITALADGDIITRGSYKGMSERSRYLLRVVPGAKSTYALSNLANEKKTYDFYNSNATDTWTNPIFFFIKKEMEAED